MKQIVSDFSDAAFEQVEHTTKTFKQQVVKGIPQAAKTQISRTQKSQTKDATRGINDEIQDSGKRIQDKKKAAGSQKIDPITGKPVPSKKVLNDLSMKIASLSAARIKRVREELEKQRLKTESRSQAIGASEKTTGPEVETVPEKPKEDVIAKTLKGSKSTGEFKGLIGG